MANIQSAKKRARQTEKRRKHNASARSMMRTYLKQALQVIAAGDKGKAQQAFVKATSALDKAAQKGLIHQNKAARHKSRLDAKIKAISAK